MKEFKDVKFTEFTSAGTYDITNLIPVPPATTHSSAGYMFFCFDGDGRNSNSADASYLAILTDIAIDEFGNAWFANSLPLDTGGGNNLPLSTFGIGINFNASTAKWELLLGSTYFSSGSYLRVRVYTQLYTF
jgi:hypothetical protein